MSSAAVPASYDPRTHRVEVAGAMLRVASAGTGPPLLMINGIGASIEMWHPIAARLSERRRVVMFDAPGTGWSPALRRPRRMKGLARLVVELLDELGLDRVDVLGYSWGGALAQQLGRDAPDRVRRLVLVATTPGLGGQLPSPLVLTVMSSPLRFTSKRYLERVAPIVYGGDSRQFRGRGSSVLRSWQAKPPTTRGYAQQLYAIGSWSSLSWLPTVAAPTLVIQGDDDPLVPVRNGRIIQQRLPHAQLKIAAGGGHLWLLQHPGEAAPLIDSFLA